MWAWVEIGDEISTSNGPIGLNLFNIYLHKYICRYMWICGCLHFDILHTQTSQLLIYVYTSPYPSTQHDLVMTQIRHLLLLSHSCTQRPSRRLVEYYLRISSQKISCYYCHTLMPRFNLPIMVLFFFFNFKTLTIYYL